ncbi:LytTR family DNA-binding domain-containing protein [Butyrivibrio sp. AE2032]|uniref:LytTR family DNA-binding domain-containing protein n=1 Tax=Butyrivibrio sp. AE2032 TaxID=1458463 RepID=UPI000550FA64|nr:LytTR family DNA-binding domain-containing protein [Butyrivibrio sp. AE2032]
MNIKLMLDPDDPMRASLQNMGITDDPESEYLLIRRGSGVNYIAGKKEDQQFYLDVKDICFIESMGHDIIIHTTDGTYNSGERLKALEQVLPADRFLRVSNSAIVNLKKIKRIESSLLQKFILHLTNGSKVDVTRSYYYIFRDRIGI